MARGRAQLHQPQRLWQGLCVQLRLSAWVSGRSPHINCGWKLIDNPYSGPDARKTFHGQSTWMFEHEGQAYLMLDHWHPKELRTSGYSILPVHIDGLYMEIPWWEYAFEA